MTIGMYELQSWSANMCHEAHEALLRPTIQSKAELVGCLALARLASLCAIIRGIEESVTRIAFRLVKPFVLLLIYDGLTVRGCCRAAVGIAMAVTLTALRIVVSAAGIICPELTFGLFRLHKSLLWLGLWNRTQNWHPILRRDVENNADPIRRRVLQIVMESINEREQNNFNISHSSFNHDFWSPSVTRAIREFAPPDPPPNFALFLNNLFAPVQVAHNLNNFLAPVHVSHPVLETFQQHFVEAIHEEALAVCRQGIYTKDEVEDMWTAYRAILNRAALRVVDEKMRLQGRILTLEDGRPIKGQPAGGLEEWKESLVELKQILSSMNPADRKILLLHLCADPDRCNGKMKQILSSMSPADQEVLLPHLCVVPDPLCADPDPYKGKKISLPGLGSAPSIDRCFKLIGEFSTTFIDHHMPGDISNLRQAFELPA